MQMRKSVQIHRSNRNSRKADQDPSWGYMLQVLQFRIVALGSSLAAAWIEKHNQDCNADGKQELDADGAQPPFPMEGFRSAQLTADFCFG